MTEAEALPSLVVIGNFDGVHRGHQAVLEAVCRLAAERRLRPRLLTFDPHPAVVLAKRPPALLTTIARRAELAARACPGVELVVQRFTRAFAGQSPEQFVEQVLAAELEARAVMVGLNFRFGRGRSGGIAELEHLGQRCGIEVLIEPLVSDAAGPWSSSRVREHIRAGQLADAEEILGRPHMLSGTVQCGEARGRELGFPTCNIAPAELLPPYGVYAVLVDGVGERGAQALGRGVANIGVRPTVAVGDQQPLLEVHLLDLDEQLLGASLRVHLVARLRPERRFDSLDALREQIATDVQRARELLAEREPEPALDGAWA